MSDEQVVERVARALEAVQEEYTAECSIYIAMDYSRLARAALSALPARDDALEGLRDSAIGLCAAIDNLWNHPDLVRVRSEIPESIKLNISRYQMQVRTKLAAPAQEPRS